MLVTVDMQFGGVVRGGCCVGRGARIVAVETRVSTTDRQ